MQLLYNLGIVIYGWVIRLASIGIPKAKLWVKGRRGWHKRLSTAVPGDGRVIWFHCASLGEFEQGKPLIEAMRFKYPGHFLLLTFFSPSGYLEKKDFEHVDHVDYIPLDTPANASRFLSTTNPELVVFVKYEFWVNHLNACFNRNIPTILISSVFREGQYYFGAWGRPILKVIRQFSAVFVQNDASARILEKHGIASIVAGDTRIDRVIEISLEDKELPLMDAFCDVDTFIFGSIWNQDERAFMSFIRENLERYKFVIAPHEVDKSNVDRYLSIFEKKAVKWSMGNNFDPAKHRVLVIDRIGLLKYLYRYAHIVYIGGAFGHGLHNVLEPASYRKATIFGTRYHKFPEATALVERGAAFSVENAEEFKKAVEHIEANKAAIESEVDDYIRENAGATRRIMDAMYELKILM